MNKTITKFLNSQQELTKLRKDLQTQLDEVDAILNNGHHTVKTPAQRRKGRKNALSLREAVAQAVKRKPLTRQEILEAVTSAGYVFTTKDPLSSLNAMLYSRSSGFANHGGKFSVK